MYQNISKDRCASVPLISLRTRPIAKSFNPWYFKASEVECFSTSDHQYHRLLGTDGHSFRGQVEGFADVILHGIPPAERASRMASPPCAPFRPSLTPPGPAAASHSRTLRGAFRWNSESSPRRSGARRWERRSRPPKHLAWGVCSSILNAPACPACRKQFHLPRCVRSHPHRGKLASAWRAIRNVQHSASGPAAT